MFAASTQPLHVIVFLHFPFTSFFLLLILFVFILDSRCRIKANYIRR